MKKFKNLLLLFGGNNYKYYENGIKAIKPFKKNIRIIIVTKNCSLKIIKNIKLNFPKIKIIRTNKFDISKKTLLFIENYCDLGVNIGFNYIIKRSILNILPILNPHPSYLPYNRGCHHSFWSIIDKTPAGATLHMMNEEIDGGDILFQKKIKLNKYMPASEIQKKCEDMAMYLLNTNLKKIIYGKFKPLKQKKFSYHSKKEILKKSILNSSDNIKVSYLFDLIRATYNKDNGFYIKFNNKKFLIKIKSYSEVK